MSAMSAHYLAVSTLLGVGLGILAGLLIAACTGREPLGWLWESIVSGLETVAFMLVALLLPTPRPTRMRVLG